MAAARTLPDGFVLASDTTTAAGHDYAIEYPQAESLDAVRAFYEAQGKNPDEVLLAIWNAGNKQGALQGGKTSVRDAVNKGEYKRGTGDDAVEFEGDDAVEAAVEDHQVNARGYIQGAPRGGTRGPTTAKQRKELGDRAVAIWAEKGRPPTEEEMAEIAEELGIDPDLL